MRPFKIAIVVFVLVLSVSISLNAVAQKGSSFIGITGGLSIPTGNWAKSNFVSSVSGFVSDPSGYAKKGAISGVEGAYFFSKHFGIGALANYATYKTNIKPLSDGYQDSFDVDQVTTTASGYKIWNFMPGLYFDLPVCKKLAVTARALAGISHATTPSIAVDVEDGGNDDGTFEQKEASKTAFAFDLGAGLSYRIVKCVAINLKADYFNTKPDFTIENTQRVNSAGRRIDSYNQPLAAINVSLGVAYVFGKK
jgi:opacity protein-like surface antigen